MLVATSKPAPGRVTSLPTMKSARFFSSFLAALAFRSSVSAAKATTTWSSRLFSPTMAATSGFSTMRSVSPSAPVFLILWSAAASGR